MTMASSSTAAAAADGPNHNLHPPGQSAIVLVAKYPIPGESKTRLIPLLGEQGAAELAGAMLCDVLLSLSNYPPLQNVCKILLYAPGTKEGRQMMTNILEPLGLFRHWILMPMRESTDLQNPDLGATLADGLERTRTHLAMNYPSNGGRANVLFLGMDSPELPLDEIEAALLYNRDYAHLCPSDDGGYGLLSVPSGAPSQTIFSRVLWSHSLTAVSQLKALTDVNVPVRMGRIMHDIDEPQDVQELIQRLQQSPPVDHGVLMRNSAGLPLQTGRCFHTWNALVKLKMAMGREGPPPH